MSLLFYAPKKLIAKPKHVEPPSTSYILLMSVAIFLAIILITHLVYMVTTENTINQYNTCRDKIVGFEQGGMYSSADQFKLALSYCNVK